MGHCNDFQGCIEAFCGFSLKHFQMTTLSTLPRLEYVALVTLFTHYLPRQMTPREPETPFPFWDC